jgi:3-hydroxyisobutyrate dehydrogenase-like beta-hydroxyacid dehydrogenase
LITGTGARFVDASIIGGPPRDGYTPRIYAAGPDVALFETLTTAGLNIIVLGDEIGLASAIKMCYASLTKGSTALFAELMVAAKALGVHEALIAEFQQSQAQMFARIERGLPRVPVKARRFVGEMEEMAKTYKAVGLTPRMLAGAADMYRFIGSTSLADRTPEDTAPFPSLEATLATLVTYLDAPESGTE